MTLTEFYESEKKKLLSFKNECITNHGFSPGEYPLELETEEQWLERYVDYLARRNEL